MQTGKANTGQKGDNSTFFLVRRYGRLLCVIGAKSSLFLALGLSMCEKVQVVREFFCDSNLIFFNQNN